MVAFRFRRSVKIAPGVRLNLSDSGSSVSVGGRGATVNFSKRGTRTTLGIPGTGLSYTSTSRSTSRADQRRLEREERERRCAEALANVKVSVNEEGVLTCLDSFGNALKGRDLTLLWQQKGDAIRELLTDAAAKISGDVELLGSIHLDAPHPSPSKLLTVKEFNTPKPGRPQERQKPSRPKLDLPDPPGFLSRLFGGQRRYARGIATKKAEHAKAIGKWESRCRDISEDHLRALNEYELACTNWREKKTQHQQLQETGEFEHREALSRDVDYAAAALEKTMQTLSWPRETLISFQLDFGASIVWLDVDLPEIEDLPDRIASIAASGKKLNVKAKPQKTLRLEYARHIHGIAFRLASVTASTLPWAKKINLSGFSQRLDTATGVVNDDYLFSVKFTREGLEKIDYNSLEAVDPIDAIAAFEHRRKMTVTGIFKAVEPYSPE